MHIVDLLQVPRLLAPLAAWHHAEWAKFNPSESLAQRIERMQDYLKPGLLPSTWVALEGEEPLGSAALVACDMDALPQLSPWLASVYVAADRRGQGVGTALVRHVMAQAGAGGYTHCYLFTEAGRSEQFYGRLGWRLAERRVHWGEPVVVMACDLRALFIDDPDGSATR